jgi:adenine-specific DNA-methyltransferase
MLERSEEQLQAYKNPDSDSRGPWRAQDLSASKPYQAGIFTITGPTGLRFDPPPGRFWRCNAEQYRKWLQDNRITFGVAGTGRPMLKSFLSEAQEGVRGTTWWGHEQAGHNKEATLELKALFDGESPFDTPKPVRLIGSMLKLMTGSDFLVCDFFAGSGTTAHAVMAQNAADSGSRRFVCVQLPEPLDPSSSEQRLAAECCDKIDRPRTIAELTKERIRRAAAKIKRETPMFAGDMGFRAFKLDSTNIRAWSDDPENLDAALLEHEDHLVPGRTDADLLYEILLKRGLDLCVPITERKIAGCTVHSIGAGTIYVCLSAKIDRAQAEALASGLLEWREEEAPEVETSYLFRDSAFDGDDAAKLNLTEMLKQGLGDRLSRVQSI